MSNSKVKLPHILPFVSVLSFITALIIYKLGPAQYSGPFVVTGFAWLAFFVRFTKQWKGLAFTLWVLAAASASMYYPQLFISWGGFELKKLIVPVIQLIMFGMGTTLCLGDFKRVAQMPRAIIAGMVLQFSVMPIVGFLLARGAGLEAMIAVGVILVGSCPGGVASNVITYLARGNVALSVTMTSCSTLLSPLLTPLVMKLLAQQYTQIDFAAMMFSIMKMIILPIVAGLIANRLLHKYSQIRDRVLPVFSMAGLCFSIAIITALSRDMLLTVGSLLFLVAVIHNATGYVLGYYGARALKLDETSSRTIAIEVGLQNGGMASGIAINVLNSTPATLAPAIFGAWMNVSGSILAAIWGRVKPRNKTSRSDIYYWKCDNVLPDREKLICNDKQAVADIGPVVRDIAQDYFGKNNLTVTACNGAGNHYTYIIKNNDGEFFFRADGGKLDDDYMDAEGAAMELVRKRGVKVPEVYHWDVSLDKYPIRYQLMELVRGECLNNYYQSQTLDRTQIGREVGRLLAKMHQVKLDGFGFFNTNILRTKNKIVGLDNKNRDYFCKQLDNHIKCLRDTDFLATAEVAEIESLIEKHGHLLDIGQGSVVHKDIAFWNMIGTENKVNAIIDWDDVIIGDPADDISVMKCFYNGDVLGPVYEGYEEVTKISDKFKARTSLYLVRNMLWKSVIRTKLNYFDKKKDFFLINDDNKSSLKEFTYNRLRQGIEELKQL